MVSKRSGSLPGNNNNQISFSSEDKSHSPKRQKGDNDGAAEESKSEAENSKESCPPAPEDPAESCSGDIAVGGSAGAEVESSTPPFPVTGTTAEGSTHTVVEKPRNSFSSWRFYQKQNPIFETSLPWCKLLTQFAKNPNVNIYTPSFSIGSSRECSLHLMDQSISGVLCEIKYFQFEYSLFVDMISVREVLLESMGCKGIVILNGTVLKKNALYALQSGDEVVFDLWRNHAYIFQRDMPEVAVRSPEVHNTLGKLLQLDRRSGDPSAVAGASILASPSGLRPDLSRGKSSGLPTNKIPHGTGTSTHPVGHDRMEVELDGAEGNAAQGSDKAADVGTSGQNLPHDSITEAGNVLEEMTKWTRDSHLASTSGKPLRCAIFIEDLHYRILNGEDIEVSFDDFPYYLRRHA